MAGYASGLLGAVRHVGTVLGAPVMGVLVTTFPWPSDL
jgi:hypothetical protein